MRSSKAVSKPGKAAPFVPTFTGPIEGWVVNGMRDNFFRVEATMTREDYMQEAYLVFLRIAQRYGPSVTEPKHLMALFKTAWINRLNDLANADTRYRATFEGMPTIRTEDGPQEADVPGDLDNDGMLAVLIEQAPPDVRAVLALFLAAPQEMVDMALASWRGRDRRCRAGGSAKIALMLGLDPNVDVMARVEEFFGR